MKRNPSFWPRAIATFVMGFILVVLGTTMFAWWAVGPLRLQPVMVVVVAAGFRLPLPVGGVVVLILGYLSDLVSGGVVGLQLSAYMAVYVACALAERQLQIRSWPLQMAAVGLMSLMFQVLVVSGLVLLHRGELLPPNLARVALTQAVLTALTAPLFFALLEGLVGLIAKAWPKGKGARA